MLFPPVAGRLDSTLLLNLPDSMLRLCRALGALQGLEVKLSAAGSALSSADWEVVQRLANNCLSVALGQVREAALPLGLSVTEARSLDACLQALLGPLRGTAVAVAVAAAQGPSDPETDTPRNLPRAGSGEEADSSRLLRLLRSNLPLWSDDGLDSTFCLRATLALSSGWSHRDLNQLFSALNYVIICNEG